MNKPKTINTILLKNSCNLVIFIMAIIGLTKEFSFTLSINFFLLLLWLIILFSLHQIKRISQIKEKKQFIIILTICSFILLTILIFRRPNILFAGLLISSNILVIWTTLKNSILNSLALQIVLWIFCLYLAIYLLLGFVTKSLLFKIILVFISKKNFELFLSKRKFVFYIFLVVLGIIAFIYLYKPFNFYLILQIIVPLIPRKIEKQGTNSLISSLYQIISYWII